MTLLIFFFPQMISTHCIRLMTHATETGTINRLNFLLPVPVFGADFCSVCCASGTKISNMSENKQITSPHKTTSRHLRTSTIIIDQSQVIISVTCTQLSGLEQKCVSKHHTVHIATLTPHWNMAQRAGWGCVCLDGIYSWKWSCVSTTRPRNAAYWCNVCLLCIALLYKPEHRTT